MQELITKTRIHQSQDTKSPVVITEGNELWKRMIEDVPDNVSTMRAAFIIIIMKWQIFANTPYNEAKSFALISV